MKGGWKKVGWGVRKNFAHPRAMLLDLSPSFLPPMVLANVGFAYLNPKLTPQKFWGPHSEVGAPSSPTLVMHHSSCPSQFTGRQMVQWSGSAVMDLCLGETEEGAGP